VASNQGWEYREQLDVAAEGQTVLGYLCARYRHSSEATWRERLERGEVTLDGAVAAPGQPIHPGQILSWTRAPWTEPEVPLTYAVVHEDAELLVVSKASGLPTAPAGNFLEHTLLSLVRRRDPAWTPMHRLGRATSGLVVFARTPTARSRLQAAFRGREVEKRYRALATGDLGDAPRVIDAAIGEVEHPVLGRVWAAAPGGKPALSRARKVGLRGPDSLVDVDIETGRPHQIRIHLAAAGHPLVGDPLYGPGGTPRAGTTSLPGDGGYLLHAWRLALAHPATGRRLELEAPLPDALR
jgi:23S rRNA pseudouridine1911/1915/1917 synthase